MGNLLQLLPVLDDAFEEGQRRTHLRREDLPACGPGILLASDGTPEQISIMAAL
jgi:hypothetical protein